MLSKDSRLRLVEMCCRIKLRRKVNLVERMWMTKLIESNPDAQRLYQLHLGYLCDSLPTGTSPLDPLQKLNYNK